MAKTLEDRFWPKVQVSDGCWRWMGATNRLGYGQIFAPSGHRSRVMPATTASWLLATGRLPVLYVCHSCDIPGCVNPEHLFEGTQTTNMRDSIAKGRFKFAPPRYGTANNKAKLTPIKVTDVRARYARGETLSDLSRSLGMARSTLRDVVKGRTWCNSEVPRIAKGLRTAKLSTSDVAEIIALRRSGISTPELGRRFGITQSHASKVSLGQVKGLA